MARYRSQGPDGQTYELEGPDNATDDEIKAEFQRQFGNVRAPEAAPAAPAPERRIAQTAGGEANRALRRTVSDFSFGMGNYPLDAWTAFANSLASGRGFAEEYAHQRAQTQEARSPTGRGALGTAADVASSTAGMTGQALLSAPLTAGRTVGELAQPGLRAAQSLYGRLFSSGATPAELGMSTAAINAPRSLAGNIAEGTRYGTAFGTAAGYGLAPDDATMTETLSDMGTHAVGGALLGATLPAGIEVGARVFRPLRSAVHNARQRRAEAAAERRETFEEAGVTPYPPAVAGGVPQSAANFFQDTLAGAPLRRAGGQSVESLRTQLDDVLVGAGANRPASETGEAARGLVRRSFQGATPEDEIRFRSATPEELQDISGVGISPTYTPQRPTVRGQTVQPVGIEDDLERVRAGVRPVQPREPRVREYHTGQTRPEEIEASPYYVGRDQEAQQQLQLLQNRLDEQLRPERDMAVREWNENFSSLNRFRDVLEEYAPVHTYSTASDTTVFGQQRAAPVASLRGPLGMVQDRLKIRKWQQFVQAVGGEEEAARVLQAYARQRAAVGRYNTTVQELRRIREEATLRSGERGQSRDHIFAARQREAELRARERNEQEIEADRFRARQEAEAETRRLQDEAAERARPQLEADAAEATRLLQASADRRAQREANAAHELEVARRRGQAAEGVTIPRRPEMSYPQQFAAGEAALEQNAPAVQRNPIQRRGAPTNLSRALDETALDARGAMLMPGYREGQAVNQETGELFPGLKEYLTSRVGTGLANAITTLAERSISGKFVPNASNLRGLVDELRLAKQRPGMHSPTVQRLLTALERDIDDAARLTAGGQQWTRQREQFQQRRTEFEQQVQRPLSDMAREENPAAALGHLHQAMRTGGDINVLRAAYRVAADKGEVHHMTGWLLQSLQGKSPREFMAAWKAITPETKQLIRQQGGDAVIDRIERLARVGLLLEPTMNRPTKAFGPRDLLNVKNWLPGLGYLVGLPGMIESVAGSAAASWVLSKPKFANWIRTMPIDKQSMRDTRHAHFRRLRAIGASDVGLDEATWEQVKATLMSPAQAAPFQGPPGLDDEPEPPRPLRGGSREQQNIEDDAEADRYELPASGFDNPVARRGGSLVQPALFGGERSMGGDREQLRTAQDAEQEGLDPEHVRQTTGWRKGPDGRWRYEIDDSQAMFTEEGVRAVETPGSTASLAQILHHPQLFNDYPDLARMKVKMVGQGELGPGHHGMFDVRTNTIYLDPDMHYTEDGVLGTLLHEVQHWIQSRERFAYGTFNDEHGRRLGEREAIEVEGRRTLTPEQRRRAPPGEQRRDVSGNTQTIMEAEREGSWWRRLLPMSEGGEAAQGPREDELLGTGPVRRMGPAQPGAEATGQHNVLQRIVQGAPERIGSFLREFGRPSMEALEAGMRGEMTPEEVAQIFLTHGPVGPLGMARAGRITHEQVLEMIAKRRAGQSLESIAQEYGVTRPSVHARLRNEGPSDLNAAARAARQRSRDEQVAEMVEARNAGESLEAIALRFGITGPRVHQLLREAGVGVTEASRAAARRNNAEGVRRGAVDRLVESEPELVRRSAMLRRVETRLRDEGLTPPMIARRLQQEHGEIVTARELAEGQVWWRRDDLGIEPSREVLHQRRYQARQRGETPPELPPILREYSDSPRAIYQRQYRQRRRERQGDAQ